MKSKHYNLWGCAILVMILDQGSLAQTLTEDQDNFVLPDPFYISARCNEIPKRLERLRNNLTVNIASAKKVAGQMTSLCSSVKQKQLSSDSWLTDFEKLSESLTPPCMNCVRISIPPAQPIPSNFSAYSLFLFPSAEWGKRELIGELDKMRAAFSDFGDSIGNKRAAIWFSTRFNRSDPDIERSKYFADIFKLNYNDGPFIVTSSKRPDALVEKDEVIVIKLGQISADRIVKILNVLEQDLRKDGAIRKRTLIFEEIKQRLLSVVDRNPEIAKELTKTAIGMIAK